MKVRALPMVEREPGYPITRADCPDERPCPWVACKWHLLTTIATDGRMYKARDFDEQDPASIASALHEMTETCTLDVAAHGGLTEDEIGDVLGIVRQAVQQFTTSATNRMRVRLMVAMDPSDPYLKYKESK